MQPTGSGISRISKRCSTIMHCSSAYLPTPVK
ncbi:MAG: hypothetical protein ACK5CH_11105 [Bacteroidota bacterium]